MLGTLLSNVGRYRRASLLTPVFTAGEVVMEVLIPLVMAAIIDRGVEAGDMGQVLLFGLVMLALAFVSLGCGTLAGRLCAEAAAGFAANLRDAMYENVQTFSFSNMDKFGTAGLVTRMTTDVTNVQNAYMTVIRIAVRAPLMLVSSIVACLAINARLSTIFVVAVVVLAAVLTVLVASVTGIFGQVFARYDDLNASVQENVAAIRVVKAFVREDFENRCFAAAADSVCRLFVRAEGLIALNVPVMMLVVYGCMLALSWFGARFVVAGSLTTGELTSMFSYVMQILMALMMVSMIFVMVSMSVASARRIVGVLEETPDITSPAGGLAEVADGSIAFDHVGFSYRAGSGEEVLHDVDLTIESGQTVGIVGGTGSGKSSLVALVSRLYDATSGAVLVGGRDVRAYDLDALRGAVAVVLQKNTLFSGTVMENLRWGDAEATPEECARACRLACADEFLERLPDGYETHVEQGGANFSGGQRQRLCIARALLARPRVLVLDDSTSAVDTATDARIRQALAEELPGTTKLVIAQRISSVRDADRIVVLDEGRVVGFGTHDELLEGCAPYREVCEAQAASGGDFDEAGAVADGPVAAAPATAAEGRR